MTLNRNAFSSDDSSFVRISPKGIIHIIVATIASKSYYLTLRQRHNSSLKTGDIGFDFFFALSVSFPIWQQILTLEIIFDHLTTCLKAACNSSDLNY